MKLRKMLSLFLAAAITASSFIVTSTAAVTSSDFTAEELGSSSYDIKKYTDPFWEGNIVYNEIVHPIRNKDGSLPAFELMYDATEIVTVKDYKLQVTYIEGVDYKLENGNLVILPTGNIEMMDYTDMHPTSVPSDYGEDEFMPYYPHADNPGHWEYWTGGSDVCKVSVAVTYIHNDTWEGPVPVSQESRLLNTFEKLKNKDEITIVVAGDSVATGAMSSGFLGMSPYADAYPEMAQKALAAKYNNEKIKLINSAIGGTMSYFDESKMKSTIVGYNPDLVIINFGMNDSSCGRVGISGQEFHDNLALQIEYIQEYLPECEVLLLSSLYGNRYTFSSERYEEHAAVLHTLAEEYDGVGVADPQVIEKYLIEEVGKDYICFTADNMVHPGDLGMRLSAQSIIEALSFADIETYKDALIANMKEYADLENYGEDKKNEVIAYIADVEVSIADLDEEWDITAIVDAAYPDLDKILLRCDVHSYVDTVVEPTCKEGGYTHSVCSVCKNVSTHSFTDPIGGEHIMDSGRHTTSPTYKAKGEITYSCTKCGYYETEEVPVLTNPPSLDGEKMLHVGDNHNYLASELYPYTSGSGYVELDFCPLDIEKYDGIPYIGLWFCGFAFTACYNFRAQEVQIVETALPFHGGTVYASAKYDWSSDGGKYEYNWKKFAVHLNGTTVRIYIDGELVLEDTNSFYRASSECALLYSNGECYMDNFKVVKGNYDPTTGNGGTVLGQWDFNTTSSYNSFFNVWGQKYAEMTHVTANEANVTTGQYKHTHSGTIFNIIEPGCEDGGYGEYQCDMCGEVYRKNFTEALYDSHALTNRTFTVQPTLYLDGKCTYECETCDLTFTEVIPKGTGIEIPDVIPGDVDGDGEVENSDVSLLKLFLIQPKVEINVPNSDIDEDGQITNGDFSRLLVIIASP